MMHVGKWQVLRSGTDCALLAFGRMSLHAFKAAELLEQRGVSATVVDCCSLKPMDLCLMKELEGKGLPLFTMEEGQASSGFGAEVARLCIEKGFNPPRSVMGIDDRFILQGQMDQLLEDCGLSANQIAQRVENALKETQRNASE